MHEQLRSSSVGFRQNRPQLRGADHPFLEKLFPISKDTKGWSLLRPVHGQHDHLHMYMHRSHVYDYLGPSPAASPPGHEQFTLKGPPHLKDVALMIGSAEEDIRIQREEEIGVPPTIRALEAKGLPSHPHFVTGFPRLVLLAQMFQHFAEAVLWKRKIYNGSINLLRKRGEFYNEQV